MKMVNLDIRKRKYATKRRLMIRSLLNELKNRPCADCNVKYDPCVMDFDHLDPALKEGNINILKRWVNKAKLLAEIQKCEVVCANCHRLRSKNQREKGVFYVGFRRANEEQLEFL
jgi:hypothetical protein